MICKKCGYDYPAQELKCPYCREPKPLGEKWRNEENLARKETLLAKAKIIHSMPLYVADKVMNVILLVVVAVTAITILVLAIGVGLEDIHITCQRRRKNWLRQRIIPDFTIICIPMRCMGRRNLKNIRSASGCMTTIRHL